ncbi:hypothetical protein CB0940_07879, partial [Cercospora beticola]
MDILSGGLLPAIFIAMRVTIGMFCTT